MTDTITLAGFDWYHIIFFGSIATLLWAGGLVLFITLALRSSARDSLWGLAATVWGLVGVFSLIGLWLGWGGEMAKQWDAQQRIDALVETGYEDVLLTDSFAEDGWTGSYNQEYKRGIFVQVQGEEWTIEVLSSGDQ